MLRSFLTRLVDSVTPAFLLALCLLIGLACATPFPIESLEEGMTAETVREKFGAPEAIETEPGDAEASWTYLHEEQAWGPTVLFSSIALPHCILLTPFIALFDGHPCFSWSVERKPVVLQFAEGKLASWEVLPDPRGSLWDQPGGYSGDDDSDFQDMFDQMDRDLKDAAHHKKGHKHHHNDE